MGTLNAFLKVILHEQLPYHLSFFFYEIIGTKGCCSLLSYSLSYPPSSIPDHQHNKLHVGSVHCLMPAQCLHHACSVTSTYMWQPQAGAMNSESVQRQRQTFCYKGYSTALQPTLHPLCSPLLAYKIDWQKVSKRPSTFQDTKTGWLLPSYNNNFK